MTKLLIGIAIITLCTGCYSIDDKYVQGSFSHSRQYAERACNEQVGEGSDAYPGCVDEKARRRLALWACMHEPNSWFFKEDVCKEAE